MDDVTHPSGGIYIPKFWAGILSTIVGLAVLGGFSNLWFLNEKSIQFDEHLRQINSSTATLPGALSRREWVLEKNNINSQFATVNEKLDRLIDNLDKMK